MNDFLTHCSGRLSRACVVLLLAALGLVASPAAADRALAPAPAPANAPAAEQSAADAKWFERAIGQGVIWKHYQFDSLYGARQSVSVLDCDLNRKGVKVTFPYLARSRGRTSEFVPAQAPRAVAGVNGTYFDTSGDGGGAVTFLRVDGQVITPESDQFGAMGTEGAVTITTGGAVRVERRPEGGWNNYQERKDVMANGPILIWEKRPADFAPFGAHCTSRHPRTAAGVTDKNHLILVTVDGRTEHSAGMSCEELARLMSELGCANAVNMDGGGSTTMWVAGERMNGVVNYPSDNGEYDHLGERPCSNGIAVTAAKPPKVAWDARLTTTVYSPAMTAGTSQTVTLEYENLGTRSWRRNDVNLVLTRPRLRTSELYTTGSWRTRHSPARLNQAVVRPGGKGRFTFTVSAPDATSARVFSECFGLVHGGNLAFGPADNEPRLEILSYPYEPPSTGTVIIETRVEGQNSRRYSDTGGWNDSPLRCSAPGLTPGLGQRYGSTFRTKAGTKVATFRPNFGRGGAYQVFIAYGNGGQSARDGIVCKVTDANGTTRYPVNQTANADTWVLLGTHTFAPGQAGFASVSNEDLNVSGNMYVAGMKFEPVE